MKITNKSEYLRLASKGLLGNTLRIWNSLDELMKRGCLDNTRLTIRNRIRSSPFFVPSVYAKDADKIVKEMIARGAAPESMYFQEVPHLAGCKDHKCQGCGRRINAEIMRDESSYVYMAYGTNPSLSLRADVIENGLIACGLEALTRIKTLDENCYETIQDIWDRYPDVVIEFTIFSSPVGEFKQNFVVWEARSY